jgi:hypothetical protein
MKQETINYLQRRGYLDLEENVTLRYRFLNENINWQKDCEEVSKKDKLLLKLIGKKNFSIFSKYANDFISKVSDYHDYSPSFQTGDILRKIYIALVNEKIGQTLKQKYSYSTSFDLESVIGSEKIVDVFMGLAQRVLSPIERKSQSIEEWTQDLECAYKSGQNRPNNLIVLLQRYKECYFGAIYLPKNHIMEKELNEKTTKH